MFSNRFQIQVEFHTQSFYVNLDMQTCLSNCVWLVLLRNKLHKPKKIATVYQLCVIEIDETFLVLYMYWTELCHNNNERLQKSNIMSIGDKQQLQC